MKIVSSHSSALISTASLLIASSYLSRSDAFTSTHSSSLSRGLTLRTSSHLYQASNVDVLEKLKSAMIGDESSEIIQEKLTQQLQIQSQTPPVEEIDEKPAADEQYQKGITIIGFITLLNASLSPIWHTVFTGGNGPPPLALNAIVSVVALIGLLTGGTFLDSQVESSSALAETNEKPWSAKSFRGGMELGLWKGLGTTCHIYGMSLTTANHGAFLLQLTTLIVPVIQGLRGAETIPRQIQLAVVLALAGIVAFTQDPSGATSSDVVIDAAQLQRGDTLVLGAAFFYSLYDIQTFYWGREIPRTELVTIKIGFQAVLSCLLCAVAAREEVVTYLQSGPDWAVLVPTVLWSGLIVNALATFLQVGGMQSVGPTRAQTIFASQPLWASIMNYVFIGEIVGLQGLVGGGAFLGALLLAATAKAPEAAVEAVATEELA